MQIKDRGFLIVAQNNGVTDYLKCAKVLAANIRHKMPGERIALLTDDKISDPLFDEVVIFPEGDGCKDDDWKLSNDWQVYNASPWKHTIKIEADIYLPRSIEHWWSILQDRDMVISTTIRNYTNAISGSKFYRQIFKDNHLPDVYNALTYFRKSTLADTFYCAVKDIFKNWNNYKSQLICDNRERATTDVVYGIAAAIVGVENCTLPTFTDMSMVHMKKEIIGTHTVDWRKQLIYEVDYDHFRIATIPQLYPVHYYIKDFADELWKQLYSGE